MDSNRCQKRFSRKKLNSAIDEPIIELPEKHVFVFELGTAGFAEY